MYCISDPNLNSDKYIYSETISSRPLSCPNRSCSLVLQFQPLMNNPEKEENNFNPYLQWHDNKSTFDPKLDYTANTEKIIKNTKSADNMPKIVYYQTCSQASFADYPFFHNKSSFEAEASPMLLICPSPDADDAGIDFKEQHNAFNMWMETEHKQVHNQHNNPDKWSKCCNNEWFEQEDQLTYQPPGSRCDSFNGYHHLEELSHKKSQLSVNEQDNHASMQDAIFVPCFNNNFVCTSCVRKPYECAKEVVRNNDEFFPCIHKDITQFDKLRPCDRQTYYGPVSNHYNYPRKQCRCSQSEHQHNLPQPNQQFEHSLFNSGDLASSPCSCFNRKTVPCKQFKNRCCCSDNGCMITDMSSKDFKAGRLEVFGERSQKKYFATKETWTMKYKKYKRRQTYQKLGLCFNCGEKMAGWQKGGMWKNVPGRHVRKRQHRRVPRHLSHNLERFVPTVKYNSLDDAVVTNIAEDQRNLFKHFQTSFEVIYPCSSSDFCSTQPHLSNIDCFCDNTTNHQDFSYDRMQDYNQRMHEFTSDGSDKSQFESKKFPLSASSNFFTLKLKKDKNYAESIPFDSFFDRGHFLDRASRGPIVYEDSSFDGVVDFNQVKDNLARKYKDKHSSCKCHDRGKHPSCFNCQTRCKNQSHKLRLGRGSHIMAELNLIEEETKNLENQLRMAILKKESLANNLQQNRLHHNNLHHNNLHHNNLHHNNLHHNNLQQNNLQQDNLQQDNLQQDNLQQANLQREMDREEIMSQFRSDKAFKDLNVDIKYLDPDESQLNNVQQIENKPSKKAQKSKSKPLKFGKKDSHNSGKVDKIADNFGGKGTFAKSDKNSDKHTRKFSTSVAKYHIKKDIQPQKFLIQKPNFKAVMQKQDLPDTSYSQNFQQNNHLSNCSHHSFHNTSRNPFQQLHEEFFYKNQHSHHNLPALNFCNHSHNFPICTHNHKSLCHCHSITSCYCKSYYRNHKHGKKLHASKHTEEINSNHHCRNKDKIPSTFDSPRENEEATEADMQADDQTDSHWKEIFGGHHEKD